MSAQRGAIRTYWPIVLFLITVGIVAALTLILPDKSAFKAWADIVLALLPVVAFLNQWALHNLERWRLFVGRVRLKLFNSETRWSLSVDFSVSSGALALDQALAVVRAAHGVTVRVLSQSSKLAVISLGGTTLRLKIESGLDPLSDEAIDYLRAEFSEVSRGFRDQQEALQHECFPVINRIGEVIGTSEAKYVVKVMFPTSNPYFGLFVARIKPEDVSRFSLEYFEQDATERDIVKVHRDRVEVIASTARSAEKLSLRYLALQPVGG